MMRKIALIVYCILISTLVSCASLFTPKIRDSLDDKQITQVQYYVNKTIILTREVSRDEKPAVASGVIILRDGRYIERIAIPRGTPGELMKTSFLKFDDGTEGECLGICFEGSENDSNEILYFKRGTGPRQKEGYYLVYTGGETEKVRYGDKIYKVTIPRWCRNAWPYLLGVVNSKHAEDRLWHRAIGRRVQWYQKSTEDK